MKESLLIITNLPKIQQALVEALSYRFSIKLAGHGTEALEWLENENAADAVLVDLDIPGLSCSDFVRTLRLSTLFRKTPVLLFSSGINGIKYLDCGIDDYISDPCNQIEVQIRVKNILHRHHQINAKDVQRVS